jgi:hypothetical protein
MTNFIMPIMHLYIAHKKFEGYRNSLDKKRQEVFEWLVFEVAGMREETMVIHHDHTEAMLLNILVETEMRLRKHDRSAERSKSQP